MILPLGDGRGLEGVMTRVFVRVGCVGGDVAMGVLEEGEEKRGRYELICFVYNTGVKERERIGKGGDKGVRKSLVDLGSVGEGALQERDMS